MWRLMNRWWVCIPLHLLYFYTIFCQSHTGTRESCIITHFSLFFPHAQVLTFQRGLFWTAHYLPIFLCTLNHYVERTDLTWEMGRKRAVKERFCLKDIRKPILPFVHLLFVWAYTRPWHEWTEHRQGYGSWKPFAKEPPGVWSIHARDVYQKPHTSKYIQAFICME